MDKKAILFAYLQGELAQSFYERKSFDVSYSPSNFRNQNIDAFSGCIHPGFYFVGDMRDDLHSFAKIIAAAFFLENMLVYLSGSQVVKSA